MRVAPVSLRTLVPLGKVKGGGEKKEKRGRGRKGRKKQSRPPGPSDYALCFNRCLRRSSGFISERKKENGKKKKEKKKKKE